MLGSDVLLCFIFYSTLLILKMYIIAIITGQVRLRKKAFANPEDAERHGGVQFCRIDPTVERCRRSKMSRMETSKAISTDKATVIIQVNPQVIQNTVIRNDGNEAGGTYHNKGLAEFFKAQPKALGTVQIMTGVVCFLFGIIHTVDEEYNYHYRFLPYYGGITYWGSLIYITAGALSVAAQNKLHLCVVKASLVMNVISAIPAGTSIVLMSIEIAINSYGVNRREMVYSQGNKGLFLVFSILQFIISIFITGFACKATSNRDSTEVTVALNQGS